MFAGVLNKGLRGGLFLCIALVISFLIISLLAIKEPESLFYPDLFYNYFSTKISNKLLIVCLNALLIVVAAYLVYQISIEEELVDKTNIYSLFLFLCINLVCCHSMQIVSQFITNTFYLYTNFLFCTTILDFPWTDSNRHLLPTMLNCGHQLFLIWPYQEHSMYLGESHPWVTVLTIRRHGHKIGTP